MELQAGDKAPDFKTKDQDGNVVSLKDFKGKKVALYFYPEDDTQVCTVQACNLRDNYAELKKHGITILGVSPNDEKSHKKFEAKYNLPFTLLVDDDLKIANKYGVWAEKVLYGNRHMGIVRSTYLINEDGKIHHIIKRALSKIHTQQILKGFGLV
ncbi:MAG TPA: thioredoxin-dependent thiol peroxidase [Flavipsychrobacter sp.]|jgi:thioredoxin-dependent peroxiredoxin|nr:thioredoxin-dependent thiol peroxidase [Chitinophagales bacterium]HLO72057.1 thioredoxin-dependent thiol peroxidase [Flavipsychrobacter sp.]